MFEKGHFKSLINITDLKNYLSVIELGFSQTK